MPSFGEQLRRERELRKVSLEEIAEATKISVRYLRALEENDFSQLPGGVFDRGFVRAYAQFVGLDEDATVEAYLAERGSEEVEKRDDGLDALRSAVDTRTGGRMSSGGGPGDGRALRMITAVIVVVGVVSLAAWALSRYFQPGESGRVSPREIARLTAQTAGEQPLETPPESLPADASNQVVEPGEENPGAITTPAVESDRAAVPQSEIATPIESSESPVRKAAPPEADPRATEQADPSPPAPSQEDSRNAAPLIDARILVDRAATGRINCDNRRVETLDGLRPGTVLNLRCRRFLLLNLRDGGAVRVGLNGETPLRLAADGEPLDNYEIYP